MEEDVSKRDARISELQALKDLVMQPIPAPSHLPVNSLATYKNNCLLWDMDSSYAVEDLRAI